MYDGIIDVEWCYPRRLESVLMDQNVRFFPLLYCISKKWRKREKLLYIGMTMSNVHQRLRTHQRKWLADHRGDIFVRLGLVRDNPTDEWVFEDADLIRDVESALIYETKPFQNINSVYYYRYYNQLFIQNRGFRGMMPPVVDMLAH